MEQDACHRSAQERPEARYANYFEVAHSTFEFIIDFGQYQPDTELANRVLPFVTIVMSPAHAKTLAGLMVESIRRYEADHGAIDDPARPLNVTDDDS